MTFSSLAHLPIGKTSYIKNLHAEGPLKRRLLDMGFVQNTPVTCLFESPCGGMRAYRLRGTVVALRCEDALTITIGEEDCYGR